jgi:hypothetical protein
MSVPLDRLYNFIDSLCNHNILIYHFRPHGSKNLNDLSMSAPLFKPTVDAWYHNMTMPLMICHDQEPLDYDLHSNSDFSAWWNIRVLPATISSKNEQDYWDQWKNIFNIFDHDAIMRVDAHFRSIMCPINLYDLTLLCHSEKNSKQVQRFENNQFVGVYWWSHGIIARDWFRYAEHDPECMTTPNTFDKDFLVYNRAWSGTREYRLTFAQKLIQHNLVKNCDIKFSPVDQEIHYTQHIFQNPKLQIDQQNIEEYITLNQADSSASADYVSADYQQSAVEVVLETLFDDDRWHLTEKSLRPVACGKPFILLSTPGSLEYLRSYGIRTFHGLIDETYDTIQDPELRLNAVVREMNRISSLPIDEKKILWAKLHEIAQQNRQLFFSTSWECTIVDEFIDNINHGLKVMANHRTGKYWKDLPRVNNLTNSLNTRYENKSLEWINQPVLTTSISKIFPMSDTI